MIIRPAKSEDYDAVMRLYNGFVAEDRYSKHDNDSFRKVLASPSSRLFVADDDGKLIGFAAVSTRFIVRYPRPIAELDELFVDPEARAHGVGSLLMEAVEAFAREQHCYRLYIESAYEHKIGHSFYEHLGYKNNGYHFLKNL